MAPACCGCNTAGVIKFEPLDTHTTRVRWLRMAAADLQDLPRWRGMLDAEEKLQADRFAFAADSNAYTAAHALVRAMLSAATGLPTTTWRYARRPFGKPVLAAELCSTGLHFSLSHTRGFVACAIAFDDIGLDVETSSRKTDFGIADQFFAPEEARLVRTTPPEQQARLLFRFWTLKEAFIKATGEGLRRPLNSFSFSLDPLRIAFHPERHPAPFRDDPAAWRFITSEVAESLPLALAAQRPLEQPFRLDMREAQPHEVKPLA